VETEGLKLEKNGERPEIDIGEKAPYFRMKKSFFDNSMQLYFNNLLFMYVHIHIEHATFLGKS
jgi:hypothetical protein